MTNALPLQRKKRNFYLISFLWALGLAVLIFLPWMIYNHGYFFFYGDYNVQQIPFYQMIHDSVQSGNAGWSYTTDLGANIIGSYSFYMFGSPFFWITMAFPSEAVPYLVAPLLMIKIAFASLGAYTFLRRYVKNQYFAVFGALLYAFSGFSIYNVFFNHFHEAILIFPFLLAAVDEFIYEKRKGLLALTVFAACFMNYYFFVGQVAFVFIYWFIRMRTESFRLTLTEFLRFAVEVLLGFGASMIILLPSIYAVLQNSRVNSMPSGWGAVVYTSEQRYIHIIESFFFPPDMPAYANFTPDSNAKWASVAGWLPLFSMVGVFSFYKLKTHKWLRLLIPVLFVMAFVPVFNSIFQLLNSSYYARWFYMLTLMLVLATVISLDHEETDYKPAIKLTIGITVIIALLIGIMPNTTTNTAGEKTTTYGIEKYPDRFWVWVGIAFVSLAAIVILLCFRKKQKVFMISTSVALSVIIAGYGNVLIGTGVVNASYSGDYIIKNALGNKDQFNDIKDLKEVRSDFYNEMDNMGMYWQTPTIQAFQSIVPGSVMEFYKSVGVERSVGSRPKTEVYAIRSFLSCKYLFDYQNDGKSFMINNDHNQMPGWSFIEEKNDYSVYINDYYIPYGFTYDTYITEKEYYDLSESDRSKVLLKSIVLNEEQEKKYSKFLKHDTELSDYYFNQTEYFKDCEERRKLTCSSVKFENNLVTARIKTGDSAELVFFSIPYEKGWSAEVNGKPADIEKVNVGFMAVKVPGNTNAEIKFRYHTPGLAAGVAVTCASVVLFVVYMILWKVPRKRREDGPYLIDDLAPKKKKSSSASDEKGDGTIPSEPPAEVPEDEEELSDDSEGPIEAMAGELIYSDPDEKASEEEALADETPAEEVGNIINLSEVKEKNNRTKI